LPRLRFGLRSVRPEVREFLRLYHYRNVSGLDGATIPRFAGSHTEDAAGTSPLPNTSLTKREPLTTDIRGRLILLGTGTSVGVPMIGCGCQVCTSDHPRNHRTRCGAVLGLPGGNLLIDTPPDLRGQLLRERIGIIHAVVFTHEHADHLMGLDDLRLFQFYLGSAVPLFCNASVEERIRHSFDYAFVDRPQTHAGAAPKLAFHRIADEPFGVLGTRVVPIRMTHGPKFQVLGFRVGNVAYCTDTNGIPPEQRKLLQGLDVLVLGALRRRPHATHFSLDEAVDMARQLGPRRTYFTHSSHELDYEATNAELPPGMELAHDGLQIPLT
jgi:phosphoribosyl 1,2-cyclic phosphate phosphodiesterase